LPECRELLVVDGTGGDRDSIIAEMAHIRGENPTAARYDASMTDKQRNAYDNLILVCRNHHKKIDDQWKTYTVEKLHEIKKQHEAWARDSTEKEILNVTFAELETITKFLVSGQVCLDISLIVVPPKDKIKKNALSSTTEQQITMGLVQVKQVGDYIRKHPDTEFGERLRLGFVKEYERLKTEEHMSGDELFERLLGFACAGKTDFKEKAAALAVLAYLFEACEVFEK
jgi:hypothetical protein